MNTKALYVGIDVSKYRHEVAILDAHKQLRCPVFSVEENAPGYHSLWQRLQQEGQRTHSQHVYIGMEATGGYWKNLYYFLTGIDDPPLDLQVSVINPLRTKAFMQTELRRARTDVTSAKDIACFMVEKRPLPSAQAHPALLIVKDLYTQVVQLKKQMAALKNKLRIELAKVAPELERGMNSTASEQMMALLSRFPTAQAIQRASVEQLRAIRYGKGQWRLPQAFVQQVKALTQNSIAYQKGAGAGWAIQALIRHLRYLKAEIHRLEKRMKQAARQLPQQYQQDIQLLTSIPGIGEVSAIVLSTYIRDIQRFGNTKHFVAYFGMNPTIHQSGKSIQRASHLQKKGSHIIRRLLFMAVLACIHKRIEPIYGYYQRLRSNGKPKMVAIGAAMRKLLLIVYGVLKHQEPFSTMDADAANFAIQ